MKLKSKGYHHLGKLAASEREKIFTIIQTWTLFLSCHYILVKTSDHGHQLFLPNIIFHLINWEASCNNVCLGDWAGGSVRGQPELCNETQSPASNNNNVLILYWQSLSVSLPSSFHPPYLLSFSLLDRTQDLLNLMLSTQVLNH